MKTLDLNKDGKVNNEDVKILQQYLADLTKVGDADVDENGIINMKDVVALQQFIRKHDLNHDGCFSEKDILLIQQAIAELITPNELMDINGDSKVNMQDVIKLQQALKRAQNKLDLNKDDKIDANDVQIIRNHIAAIELILDLQYADINADGKISMIDVTTLQRILDQLSKIQTKQHDKWKLSKFNDQEWTRTEETMKFKPNGTLHWCGRVNGIKSQYSYKVGYQNNKVHLTCKVLSPDSVEDVTFIIKEVSNSKLILDEVGAKRKREFIK